MHHLSALIGMLAKGGPLMIPLLAPDDPVSAFGTITLHY